jgi:ABC-type branched-subunit amino acid transport system substrate-binding protein
MILYFAPFVASGSFYSLVMNTKDAQKATKDTIIIGLLIPDKQSFAAKYAARMAVDEFNESKSSSDHFYSLEVRDMEGPWGTGSKMMVDLVFKEKAWAVLGCVDGRNSHLAEQVSAKSHVVFLNALSGDPTLAQAFVPWYFSAIPNDIQQASAILKEINSRKIQGKIAVLSDNSYDSRMASESFIKYSGNLKPSLIQLHFDNLNDIATVIDDMPATGVSIIVLFADSRYLDSIIKEVRSKMNQEILIPLLLTEQNKNSAFKGAGRITCISPEFFFNSNGSVFINSYRKLYHVDPGSVAAFAYDGMKMLIGAVESSGNDPDKVKDNLQKSQYDGVTGRISFDEKGKRTGTISFFTINDGQIVLLKSYEAVSDTN